jgi:hypothetical protein
MFFSDGIKRIFGAGSLFSTHPPLAKRVKLLDPDFNGEFPVMTSDSLALSGQEAGEKPSASAANQEKGREFIKRYTMLGGAAGTDPETLMQQIGVLESAALETAREWVNALPEDLREMVHEPVGAQAVVLALVIHSAEQQSSADAWTWLPAALTDYVGRVVDRLGQIKPPQRLMLLDMALPALKALSRNEAERFLATLKGVIDSDHQINLFEFSVHEIVKAGLRDTMGQPLPRISQTAVADVAEPCAILLSMLAHVGQSDEESAKNAFLSGRRKLGVEDAPVFSLRPRNGIATDHLSQALNTMLTTTMPVRRTLLEAGLDCLMHDEKITVKEVELFRAFAAAMEIPVSPNSLPVSV